MKVGGQLYRTIWLKPEDERIVHLIDQRALPHRFVIEEVKTVEQMAVAIRDMHVRGAGLIGAAAGYGMYLAMLAEMEPVVRRGRDKERRRDSREQQGPEEDAPLEVSCLGELLSEGNRKQKSEEDLHSRQGNPELVEELDQLAVDALRVVFARSVCAGLRDVAWKLDDFAVDDLTLAHGPVTDDGPAAGAVRPDRHPQERQEESNYPGDHEDHAYGVDVDSRHRRGDGVLENRSECNQEYRCTNAHNKPPKIGSCVRSKEGYPPLTGLKLGYRLKTAGFLKLLESP